MGMSFISLILLMLRLGLSTADLLADVKCEEDPLGYVVPDPTYCDRYLECGPGRGGSIKLCASGQALDLQTGFCQVEDKVDCSTREMRYQKERVKLTSPVRRFHSRGGPGLLSRGGSTQDTERNLSKGGPSQSTERNPPTSTATLPSVTEASLEEDENKPRLDLFGSRRRPSILSSKTTSTVPETVSSTIRPKPFVRNSEEESSITKLPPRQQSSFTRSKTSSEDVASSTAEHLNEARTDSPRRRGLFTRINNPTRRPLISTDPLLDVTCDPGADEYVVPDPTHCDRYLSCPEGQLEICQRGLVIDLDTGYCIRRRLTDCKGRERLFREVENEAEAKLDEKVKELEEDSRLKSKLAKTKPIRTTISPAPTSKTVSSHSPDLIPSFEVDDTDTDSRSSFSRSAFPSRSVPNSPSTQDGLLARKPVSSSSESFTRITVSKPSLSDDTNPGRPLRKSSSPHSTFPKIQSSKPGFSDDNNPGRLSTTTTTTTIRPANDDPLDELTCELSEAGYIVPDPEQCDRFAECSFQGEKFYKFCPIGLVLSMTKGVCDYPEQVDCSDRPKLQSSLGKGQCPRQNGQFVVAVDTSCRQYVDCRGGEGFIKSCGVGQVFDDNLGCVHPDQTTRNGCSALDPDEFQCPTTGLGQKFGDHDRLSHPTDCKLFYSCLKNGQKRLLGCQKPAVFNPETGLCDAQENVPGCEGYYVQEVVGVDKEERNKIAQEIREQLIKEFGLDRRFS